MPDPGRCASGYRLEEPTGRNDLVESWRATELRRGVPRGLRILSESAAHCSDAFVSAALAQRVLIHPNRLQVLELIDIDGRPAIVTEHVTGPSLSTWLRVHRRS